MKSRASIKGHAIHPILVAFPIAFLTGGVLTDLAALMWRREALWTIGGYLLSAGIISGLVAAIPGLIDFLTTVPPQSSGKKRALKHALVNAGALSLFTIALLLRARGIDQGIVLPLALQMLALALLSVGGWLGGTLVARNQIGIDHRYAQAGKWREQHISIRDGQLLVDKPDLKVDQMMLLHAEKQRVVLGRTKEGFVAFDDHCTHRGGSLADGVMMCGTVQCPWHGSQFEVSSGAVAAGPAKENIHAYRVEENGKQLRIWLTPRPASESSEARAAD